MKTIAIIPARFSSSRFPGKVLIDIAGKSMIQRVYEQALQSDSLSDVIVATDDEKVHKQVTGFGGIAMMTSSKHQSGTDRCAEVVKRLDFEGQVLNIQGDEPFIQPSQINQLVNFLLDRPDFEIVTLAKQIKDAKRLFDPNTVKLVFSKKEEALYFSRQCIPFVRGVGIGDWMTRGKYYKHIGMYAYSSNALLRIADLPKGDLEKREALEQLRWLEQGYRIGVCITEEEAIGIDTPEDLKNVITLLRKGMLNA